jgi:hypothetical protein
VLAAVKAVVDHDAVIVGRPAPASGSRMLAEIIDRNDVISVDLPGHLIVGAAVHRLFLVSGFWDGASIDLCLPTDKLFFKEEPPTPRPVRSALATSDILAASIFTLKGSA